jgi:CHAT domain-containing protein
LAKAYLANGQNREAEGELSKCITLMEEAREQISDANSRGAFLASQQSVYCAMVSFQFFNNKDPEQAFNYAEIAKGRDLLDALSGTGHVTASDGQVKLALSQSVTPLKFEQVQRALPPNAQLVQYAVGKDRLMIWHITRDRFSTATADIGADALRTKVMAYLDGLHGRGEIEDLNRKASELYQLLIAPIGDKLDRKLALCITPDGVIQDLPFAALVAPESKRYLIEDFALVTNTSASVFARTLDLSRSKPNGDLESFLGVGNPYFSPQRFSDLRPLPAAEQELDRIRSFYPKNQILTRKQATESAVMKQIGDYEIVHLATHALSDKESSMLSSIVLADESNPVPEDKKSDRIVFDGALHAHEILRLKPGRTRLVLLSSCSSGIGGGDRNEAMSGLAQSFLVAGVPTVVASLWDVDDESAAALMEKLHAAHRTNKMDFGQALRQAQLSYLQTAPLKKRHPFFWSTFIVTGNGLAN